MGLLIAIFIFGCFVTALVALGLVFALGVGASVPEVVDDTDAEAARSAPARSAQS